MINRLKLRDAKRLLKSKTYVLVTEDETSLHGEFQNDMDRSMQLAVLQEVRDRVDKVIKEVRKRKVSKTRKNT